MYEKPLMNQLAVVRLLKTPFADIQHMVKRELTVFTFVSSSIQIPRK